MQNHMIIGLGGTGGKIIRSFRKTIYQNYNDDVAPKVNLSYLFVDSSPEMMDANDPSWKILGHSVQLPPRNQMQIRSMNLKDIFENLNQYPKLKPWVGHREDWADMLTAAQGAQIGAQQKRRLGRLMFAVNAGDFCDNVNRSVRDMQRDNSRGFNPHTGTTFHVCCGLAGGTGSGSLIDAISQIRNIFLGEQYRILLYLLLPERNPDASWLKANYFANGYAALVELNALALGAWSPHDVFEGGGSRLVRQDPFNCCYLFNDENEANIAIPVGDLPDIVSSFLFQKIVQINNIDWGADGNLIIRQEGYENNDEGITPERSASGSPRRTRRFFSFGVKRIAYPEIEIGEYLTYSFARQAAHQLLYNQWIEGVGFKDEATPNNFQTYVRDPATLTKWYLTDERLMLSEGILNAELENKNWRPINDYWKALVPNYVTHVMDQYKGSDIKMLAELTKLCENAFREEYRGCGVGRFYQTQRAEMADHVRQLRRQVEGDLFSRWRNGEMSMHEVDRLVQALIDSFEERLSTLDSKIAKLDPNGEAYRLNENKISENGNKWVSLGPLSVLWGKRKQILNAQAEWLIARYSMKTRMEGLRHARDLVSSLRTELQILSGDVGKCKQLIAEAAKDFEDAMNSRLMDRGNEDISGHVVRQYDPDKVRSFTNGLTRDRAEQKKQATQAREELVKLLGDRLNFANFAEKITKGVLKDTVESSCKASAKAAHADALASNPERGKVLDVDLIDLLQRDFDANQQALNQYTQNVMDMAKNYLKMDKAQQQLQLPGVPRFDDPRNSICKPHTIIIAPEAPDKSAFRKRFCDALLRSANPSGKSIVVTNKERPQEITVINMTGTFPARFVGVVAFLKREYQKRLTEDGHGRAFLELHLEGKDFQLGGDQELYDLFAETYTPADIRPWVRLAESLGLIQAGTDYETGRSIVELLIKNRYGLAEKAELGADTETVIQEADPAVLEKLQAEVKSALRGDYIRVDKRKDLSAAILGRIQTTGETMGVNAPLYKQDVAAYSKVQEILELGN
jgi:hypothetical protein